MSRCIELAGMGIGAVSPNPMVGALLVHDGRIIAEGYHERYGGPHAEVCCLQQVSAEDRHLISQSTLYVSLEPCSHHGKTPPCADLIIEQGICHVVVGSHDPNPLVAGSGIAKLKAAGISVTEHIIEKACDYLNRRFMTYHTQQRPYIILKWAQSADGYIAPHGDRQQWLTNDYSRKLTHRWRTEEDAILVGTRTALIDNPQLTARYWPGRNPVRILIDRSLKVPDSSHIYDEEAMTIVYNGIREGLSQGNIYIKINDDSPLTSQIAADLYRRHIQSVIIEGGAETLQHFIAAGLWDEARVITVPAMLDDGIPAPRISGQLRHSEDIAGDRLSITLHHPA